MSEFIARASISPTITARFELCGPCAECDEPAEPELFLFYAFPVPSGGFDSFSIGALGTGIAFHDDAQFASVLKTNVTPNSGACMQNGDGSYSIWILAEEAPTDWLWNGSPIEWNQDFDFVYERKCYDTGFFPLNGGATVNDVSQHSVGAVCGSFETEGFAPAYNNPGFQAFWDSFVVKTMGEGVTGLIEISGDTIRLQVFNTYLPLQINITQNPPAGGVQLDPFNKVACP